jgi:DNA polymerase III subunit beta
MKFTACTAPLAHALALASLRSDKRVTVVPAHLIAAGMSVSIACCNSFIAIRAEAPATVSEPGEITVSADRLAALLAGFRSDATITLSATMDAATITSTTGRYRLAAMLNPPDQLKLAEETSSVELAGGDFLRLFEPLFAVGTESSRFFLCGLYWRAAGNRLVSTATNGTKLIRISVPAGDFAATILPTEAATVLQRLIKSTKPGTVMLRRSLTLMGVTTPAFEFTSRLIDAKFPDCERVIPAASANAVTINRAALLAALARLDAVAVEPKEIALCWDDTGSLGLILARQPNDGADNIPANTSGVAKFAVPLNQFAAMLGEFDDENIRIENGAANQPVVFRGNSDKSALIATSYFETAELKRRVNE